MEWFLITLTSLLSLASIASVLRRDEWWIRVFDFPRLQLSVGVICGLFLSFWVLSFDLWWHYLLLAALLANLAFQGIRIYPYTIFAPIQVKKFRKEPNDHSISILVSNVLTPNRKVHLLLKHIDTYDPDIVLTLESDQWWQDQLAGLKDRYPFQVNVPKDNLYGMHLFSKLELIEHQVLNQVKADIPSIEALVKLRSGKKVKIFCLHPEPPSPTESDTSTDRDAEILLTGRKVVNQSYPCLVFGDLNDVAWSKTTRLFQKISQLLDPRRGRGFFSTFHAKYPLLRWPLDHLFHSADFQLIKIKRLSSVGSDHFPLYSKLQLTDNYQETPVAAPQEKKRAKAKIKKADPIRKKIK
ncbi:endonuclease/exonuclease/phosphatase family protein [Ekhidna sp.]|uniref:endonuclease/exonuclease/phosphatase family protein n=1 Tax=Ekhidna sp. TaxID=2608089 RepID=UPI003B514D59